ncbi:DUF3310 domain-containing protein [Corynebacterium striatum]
MSIEKFPKAQTAINNHNPIHPKHYTGFTNKAQPIDIAEHLNFNRGNVIKYVARAGDKHPDTELEDLKKAHFYLQREINRLENNND